MSENKYIYDFKVSIPVEVEKDGVKVQEKKEVKILIKKPTRRQREEADIEHSSYFFKMQDAGLYTKQQVAKRYNNAGGDLSKPEIDYYIELQTKLATYTLEAQRYLAKGESATPEEKKSGEEALGNISVVKRQIVEFETQRSEIFNHTADNKAFYRLLSWFTVFLAYKEENGVVEELFKGETFEERLDYYESQVDAGNSVIIAAKEKLPAIIAYWVTSGAKTREDFKPIEEELNG